jgi:hypothetical protein
MGTLIGFLAGYVAGMTTGPEVTEQLRRSWQALADSPELDDVVSRVAASVKDAYARAATTVDEELRRVLTPDVAADGTTAGGDPFDAWTRFAESTGFADVVRAGRSFLGDVFAGRPH